MCIGWEGEAPAEPVVITDVRSRDFRALRKHVNRNQHPANNPSYLDQHQITRPAREDPRPLALPNRAAPVSTALDGSDYCVSLAVSDYPPKPLKYGTLATVASMSDFASSNWLKKSHWPVTNASRALSAISVLIVESP